jgi:hypothetical protein
MNINLEIIDGDLLHVWDGAKGKIMVSKEEAKTLTCFSSIDDAVSALYLAGHKSAARKLNGIKKEGIK